MAQTKVVEEVAAQEFARMCEANRIEHDATDLDEEGARELAEVRDPIVRDIMSGRLVIDTAGRPVYTPDGGKPITFNRATGATLMALETHGKGRDVSNMVAAMADMTGAPKGEFSRLAVRDFQACGRIARLFLADQ
jgi:hypothetical protein